MIELLFRKHVVERYAEKMENIEPSNINKDGTVKLEKLEKQIRRSGTWYLDITNKIPNQYICIVNNLKVYMAHLGNLGDIIVDTVYPYKKKLRRFLVKLERCNPLEEKVDGN